MLVLCALTSNGRPGVGGESIIIGNFNNTQYYNYDSCLLTANDKVKCPSFIMAGSSVDDASVIASITVAQ